ASETSRSTSSAERVLVGDRPGAPRRKEERVRSITRAATIIAAAIVFFLGISACASRLLSDGGAPRAGDDDAPKPGAATDDDANEERAAAGDASVKDDARRPNRLADEKSPYLLQHAYNPVDWHPWGDEAFEKARREGKPIFLSIGYSTCHWCHVMERE